jgi:hypothetical protein
LAVAPYHIDWKLVALTNRNGTPASRAIARATWVLPVPGAPSNSSPRRGRAAHLVAEGLVGEEQVERADDVVLDLRRCRRRRRASW